jgi:hypothetical protein
MLEKEFKYYIDNQIEFVQKYEGKYIVIIGNAVVGIYNTEIEAYDETKKKYELGTFLIQFVSSGEKGYTQTFHSRALFIN